MNTNSIYIVGKYLLLALLIFIGFACEDDEEAEDTSTPVLVSQNIADGDVVGPDGYVELVFSKAMRQAPDTEIYFNGRAIRISINYEKVRYSFSDMENEECTFPYLIFMNNTYMVQTTATSVTLTNTDDSVVYTVRAASRYGSLSRV